MERRYGNGYLIDDMTGGYFGYWAIEAAAVTYLTDVNDESFPREHGLSKTFSRVCEGV